MLSKNMVYEIIYPRKKVIKSHRPRRRNCQTHIRPSLHPEVAVSSTAVLLFGKPSDPHYAQTILADRAHAQTLAHHQPETASLNCVDRSVTDRKTGVLE